MLIPAFIDRRVTMPANVAGFLDAHHYLGRTSRGWAWSDEHGVIVFSAPTSRRLPKHWLELSRWCLIDGKGSQQWAAARRFLVENVHEVTTIVSYSDPAAGHTGALYRACNWAWAPTWHRLRPPPTGHGSWSGEQEGVKDRWVDPLRRDDERQALLSIDDESLMRRFPWAEYREPRFKRDLAIQGTAGGDWKRWNTEQVTP
jgi:hypothetical protein